jgi:arsenate reductase-like glutaredoxin family protein
LRDLVNMRSPSFKALRVQVDDDDHAIELMTANPRLMIRPALADGREVLLGFDEMGWDKMVAKG